MNNLWIIVFLVIFGSGIRSDELKLGELVEQSGTWEQNGIVLILHQINFDGTLFKFRAGFRNTNALWIQIWTQIEFSGKTMNFRLENQWKYESSTLGIVTVNLPEGQLKIGADGPIVITGTLSTTETKTTATTKTTTLTTRTTTYMSDDITGTRTSPYNSINTTLLTEFSEPTSSTKPITNGRQVTGTKTTQVLIISLAVTFGVLLLFGITLGCVLFQRKRREVEASNRRYVKTNNPMYGITLADPDPKHVQQPITNLANVKDELNTLTTSNIYTTVNSGIYVELDEDEIKKA
ncbi:hypothetical protein LSH36_582g03037 [Paralvinella palmiformis]|uniref:Uncharacterized protein n=1 Tax=Paralvinella palmiformis TaxID=53620 RepID=A0AAD9J5M0_9ANNE|nr:hypothetical protein LSH36_582g03037 [Paralvinella palmiformis]